MSLSGLLAQPRRVTAGGRPVQFPAACGGVVHFPANVAPLALPAVFEIDGTAVDGTRNTPAAFIY